MSVMKAVQRIAYPNTAPTRVANTVSPLPMVREATIAPGPKNAIAVPRLIRPRRFSGGSGILMLSSLSTFVSMILLSRCPYGTLGLRDKIRYIDATAPAHLPQLRGRLWPDGHA
jgi:hypothetical protein